jgi:signal transduction histidine kinase
VRPLASTAVVVAAMALILGLSIASARREQRHLLDEFTVATRKQALATVDVLAARLDALDQDTRLLTDLVEQSRRNPEHDPKAERRTAETTFRALAIAVPHYRLVSLNRPDGAVEILAADPTETGAIIEALRPHMERLARAVSTMQAKALGEPVRYGARSFLLYGTPVAEGGAVVVASDAAMFLGAGSWTPLPASRLYVTDPGGVVWAGCETSDGCRATDADVAAKILATSGAGAQIGPDGARAGGVTPAPAVEVSARVDRPTGSWVVTWVASTHAITRRQQWLIARIVLAAIAAALTVAGVGMVILRQQRRAIALEGELRYARALAEARDLENQLVRAEKLITVGVLSTEMAHEIGSPLAVIRGRAEQVLREVRDGPRAEDLRVIIKHIDNVSTTVRQILDFSRRPAGERRAIPASLAVERARELLQWKLDARQLALDVELETELPALAADPDQLQQVLVNLLLNACDASAPGGRLRLAARTGPDGMVRIEIADHGTGIPPEHLNAVFDPFFTTKQRGEGTGLGLPIAASIVRNHGGHIDLASQPGEGTTATVLWPALRDGGEAHA